MEVVCSVYKTKKSDYDKAVINYQSEIQIDTDFLHDNRVRIWTQSIHLFVTKHEYAGNEFSETIPRDHWLSELVLMDKTVAENPWLMSQKNTILHYSAYQRVRKALQDEKNASSVFLHYLHNFENTPSLVSSQWSDTDHAYATELPTNVLCNYSNPQDKMDVYLIHYAQVADGVYEPEFVTWVNKKIGFGINLAYKFISGDGTQDAIAHLNKFRGKEAFVRGFEAKTNAKLDDWLMEMDGEVKDVESIEEWLKFVGFEKDAILRNSPVVFNANKHERNLTDRVIEALKSVGNKFKTQQGKHQEQPEIVEISNFSDDDDDIFDWS